MTTPFRVVYQDFYRGVTSVIARQITLFLWGRFFAVKTLLETDKIKQQLINDAFGGNSAFSNV